MKLLTVLLGVFCLAYGLSAAPITSGALPDETVLLDSSDPFGLGYKFTMSGVDYYWTNQPTVVEKDVTALTALGASNTVYVGWFQGLWSKSNEWNAAFAWGNWAAPVASNTAAIVVLQTNAVPVSATNGWTVTSHDGFLTNETDAAALEALAGKKFTRWYDPEDTNRWAVWDGGTNIVIYRAEVIGTNLQVTLSGDFLDTELMTRPSWSSSEWPFGNLGDEWTGTTHEGNLAFYSGPLAKWGASGTDVPAVLLPINPSTAQGTATVSIASFNLATNIEYRYFLPTNAIPYEFQNIDYMQAWLNELYARKSVVDGHITDGTHTNVTLAGTVTLTNGTSFAAGSYYGTNGVFFTRDGTNNWILFQ